MKKTIFIIILLIGLFGYSQAKLNYVRLGKLTTVEIAAINVTDTSVIYTAYDTTLGIEVINLGAGWIPRMSAGTSDGVITAVALNGTSLDFTGSGGAFNSSVDLSTLVGGSGDLWGDPVDAPIIPDVDLAQNIGTAGLRFGLGYFASLDLSASLQVDNYIFLDHQINWTPQFDLVQFSGQNEMGFLLNDVLSWQKVSGSVEVRWDFSALTQDRTITISDADFTLGAGGGTDGLGSSRNVGPFTVNNADSATLNNSIIATAHIQDDAVTTAQIAPSAVTTNEIQDNAVTADKILNSSINGFLKLQATSVTIDKLSTSLGGDEDEILKIVGGNVAWAEDNIGISGDASSYANAAYKDVTRVIEWDYSVSTTPPTLAAGEIALRTKGPPAEVVSSTTVLNLADFKQIDDSTTDTSTWTISGDLAGGQHMVKINLSAQPSITGATPLPNSASFIANTPMIITLIVFEAIGGNEIGYFFTEWF